MADLTAEHHGWLISVPEPGTVVRRMFVLGKGFGVGVRRWSFNGEAFVGLCDESTKAPGIVGTERTYLATTPCQLVRQVRRPRRASAQPPLAAPKNPSGPAVRPPGNPE